MNKTELLKKTARACDMTEARAKDVVNALTDIILKELKAGGSVKLDGFGKFYTKDYKGRRIKDLKGEWIEIKDRKSPRFRPSGKLKQQLI